MYKISKTATTTTHPQGHVFLPLKHPGDGAVDPVVHPVVETFYHSDTLLLRQANLVPQNLKGIFLGGKRISKHFLSLSVCNAMQRVLPFTTY